MKRITSIAVTVLATAATSALGQTTVWTNAAGGTFSVPGNWSAGVPTTSSTARFNLPASYTVAFDAAAAVSSTAVEAGVVTFDLAGRDYTTVALTVTPAAGTAATVVAPTLRLRNGRVIVSQSLSASTLEVRDATNLTAASATIGKSLTVTGQGSTFIPSALQFSSSQSGAVATTTLNVSAAAALSVSSTISVGDNASINAIVVDGSDSLLATGGLSLATNGYSSLTVRNSASVRTASGFSSAALRAATSSGGQASIVVDAATLQMSEISLGSFSTNTFNALAGTATMSVKNGGLVQTSPTSSIGTSFLIAGYSSLELDGGTVRGLASLRNEGVIRGGGDIAQPLTNVTTGRIFVSAGRALRNASSAVWTNTGQISVGVDGELDAGSLNNDAGGLLTLGSGATLRNRLTTNRGSVAVSAGHVDVTGDFNNIGTLSVLTLSNGASITFAEDVVNEGRINLNPGTSATFLGSTGGPGSYTGTGTAIFEGDLRPGASPARVGFGGNVIIGGGASLNVELGGRTRGTQYDAVDVTGSLTLGGATRLTTLYGFTPLPGDVFDIAHFETLSGGINLINATGFAGLTFTPQIGTHAITLAASGTPGDANLDARVNFDDLVTLAQNYAQPGTWLEGDFDHDGIVTFDDLVSLAQHYEANPSNFTTAFDATFSIDWKLAQALAPEPITLMTPLVIVSGATFRGQRRSSCVQLSTSTARTGDPSPPAIFNGNATKS